MKVIYFIAVCLFSVAFANSGVNAAADQNSDRAVENPSYSCGKKDCKCGCQQGRPCTCKG